MHRPGRPAGVASVEAALEARRDAAWRQGAAVPMLDSAIWRMDHHGHMMRFEEWGDDASEFGWVIAPCDAAAIEAGADPDGPGYVPVACRGRRLHLG